MPSQTERQPISIHGHEVMALMLAHGAPLSKRELETMLADKFGEQAHFHTCSARELSADELISLLKSKGKMIETTTGLVMVSGSICQH